MLEKILNEEKKIKEKIEEQNKELEKIRPVRTLQDDLEAHYQKSIKVLYEEVYRLIRTNENAPVVHTLLIRDDGYYTEKGSFEVTHDCESRFNLYKNSDGTLIRSLHLRHIHSGQHNFPKDSGIVTLNQLLEDKNTLPQHLKEMYENLIGFIKQYRTGNV